MARKSKPRAGSRVNSQADGAPSTPLIEDVTVEQLDSQVQDNTDGPGSEVPEKLEHQHPESQHDPLPETTSIALVDVSAPPLPDEPIPIDPPLPDEPVPAEPPVPDGPVPVDPPLPEEPVPNDPPLPSEPVPTDPPADSSLAVVSDKKSLKRSSPEPEDDGWEAVYDSTAAAYYFYNKFTQETTWENPRVPSQPVGETLAERLARDEHFLSLSKADRVKKYQELLAKEAEEQEKASQQTPIPSVVHFDSTTSYETLDVDTEDPDTLMNLVAKGKSLKAERAARHVTKQDLHRFKRAREEKKEKLIKTMLID